MSEHTTPSPDPDPETATGLEPGGEVPPGTTPPGESSMPGAGPQERYNPTKGWGPVPVVLLILVVIVCAGFFAARIASL
ncbi:DUF6480 family protein [Streptomyces sp. NPDC059740]|uniref:DUF6480 family protein n=1 Tax=Streptomyces sp. NPDC059740 TaxID=3346926 RepID=UPI00364E2B29